jgi:hypothetical protein
MRRAARIAEVGSPAGGALRDPGRVRVVSLGAGEAEGWAVSRRGSTCGLAGSWDASMAHLQAAARAGLGEAHTGVTPRQG